MKKRGISTIVATVLIVLITVAAVTILWAAISPLLNIQADTACFNVADAVNVDSDKRYTCIDANNNINIRVERGANTDELSGVEFFVESRGNTIDTNSTTNLANLPQNGGYAFNLSPYDSTKIRYDSTGLDPTDVYVSIAPQVLDEGEASSCTTKPKVKIEVCT